MALVFSSEVQVTLEKGATPGLKKTEIPPDQKLYDRFSWDLVVVRGGSPLLVLCFCFLLLDFLFRVFLIWFLCPYVAKLLSSSCRRKSGG